MAMGWMIWIQILAEARIFLFAIASSPALEPTQSPNQHVQRALSAGAKWSKHEANHSLLFSAKIRKTLRTFTSSLSL
jgi:hypothetical protein